MCQYTVSIGPFRACAEVAGFKILSVLGQPALSLLPYGQYEYRIMPRHTYDLCTLNVGFYVLYNYMFIGLCQEGEDCFTGHIMVFDLGMGTLTVSVLQAQSGLVRIVCSRTYPEVGGVLLDSSLITLLSQEFKRCVCTCMVC